MPYVEGKRVRSEKVRRTWIGELDFISKIDSFSIRDKSLIINPFSS